MAEQENRAFVESDPDILRRLEMGCFPRGADIIPNPYNKIPGFSWQGRIHFLPGFPVMAWPMMEAVLKSLLPKNNVGRSAPVERSVIVFDGLESRLTPLMCRIEAEFAGIKVFSLPSVDHPEYGKHIDLGVKGFEPGVSAAFEALLAGVNQIGARIGPILVR